MIKTTLNWTVKQLKNMFDNKQTLSFNHPIQRQSSQWDNTQQSLLIHSLLASFPVPSIYLEKREVVDANDVEKRIYSYSVLDGKQRMTTIFSYINGEYSLSEDIPAVELEGTVYEISNKFFDELDEDIKQEILRFKFNIIAFEDVTDEEIEEIFFRLNNSTPLTKAQKSKPLAGVENSILINEITSGRFFSEKCNFSKMQLKKSDDMCALLQSMMLLDVKHRGYEYKDISQDSVMEYSKYINGNYPPETKEKLKKIIGFLDNCFYMKEKNLKKINIPIVVLLADEALERGIINSRFRSFFYDFFEHNKEEYSQYCSSGSVKKEKTEGRIRIMKNAFEEFFKESDKENNETLAEEVLNESDNITKDDLTTKEETTSLLIPVENDTTEKKDNENIEQLEESTNETPASTHEVSNDEDSTNGNDCVTLGNIIDFSALSRQIATC